MSLLGSEPLRLAPGQTRPMAFHVHLLQPSARSFHISIVYTIGDCSRIYELSVSPLVLQRRSISATHKYTFRHSSGIISYAILRAPPLNVADTKKSQPLPVMVMLHGAGLEADSAQVRRSLDRAQGLRAWVLFPTGATPWSGDDWRMLRVHHFTFSVDARPDTWGFADVEAAINAIPAWIVDIGWKGPSVNVNRWLVVGHSNGGRLGISAIPQILSCT